MNLRAYFFGNMYLSSIQQGVQALHAVTRMFVKYDPALDGGISSDQNDILYNWAENYETVILLNAGYSSEIQRLIQHFDNKQNEYPWSPFYEGRDALNNTLTTVGIILPEKIYETSKYLRDIKRTDAAFLLNYISDNGKTPVIIKGEHSSEYWDINPWELKMIKILNLYGLAK